MSAPPVACPPPGEEEVDLWWGSYAGRNLTPSFAVCLVLTVVIYALVRELVKERVWLPLAFFGTAGLVWLVQLTRWCHRLFTCNYRLTTRYLYVDRGIRPLIARRFELQSIQRVEVRASKLATWLGVGDVWVYFKDPAAAPAVLQGVYAPHRAAELVRVAVAKINVNLS
jgi:hypothetical protein